MKKLACLLLVVGLLGACGGAQTRDLPVAEAYSERAIAQVKNPDSVEVFMNADLFPNLARVCIDGVAILTTTREPDSILRVPEWDQYCPKD